MNQVVQDFGKIDIFVANAGMAISKPILEQTLPEFDKQMSVNGRCNSLSSLDSIYLTCNQSMASSIVPNTSAKSSSVKAAVFLSLPQA